MSAPKADKSLHILADRYRENGDYEKAEMIYKSLLSKASKGQASTLSKPNHAEIAALTSGLATVYTSAQEYDKALPMLKKAVIANKKVHGSDSHHLTVQYHNLGEMYRQKKDFSNAEKWLKLSVKNAEKRRLYSGPKDRQGEKDTLLALTHCYRQHKQHQQADQSLEKARAKECDVVQVPAFSGRHHHQGTTATSMPNFPQMQRQYQLLRQSCRQVQVPTEREVTMWRNVQPQKRAHTADGSYRPPVYVRSESVLQQTLQEKCKDRQKQKKLTKTLAKVPGKKWRCVPLTKHQCA
jgi:hypothetical protein